MARVIVIVMVLCAVLVVGVPGAFGEQCGSQAGGAVCANGLCCSEYGWCGNTEPYCRQPGCQSQCDGGGGSSPPPPPPTSPSPPSPPSPPGQGVASIITEDVFNEMLKHRNDSVCPAKDFYTYNAFIAAANDFPGFGTTGNLTTQKRELAAFLAQTSHETTGGWATAPDGPYAWGYCFVEEINKADYCDSRQVPCAAGKQYYGRGPIQLSWNYNYVPAGNAIGFDGLNDPDIVARDPVISFETAIWFWMTPQSPKPSCHDVMTGAWTPSQNDVAAGRSAGFGMTTNIINGGLECGKGSNAQMENRIGFFERYCQMLGVSTGPNLDCANQTPYGLALPHESLSASHLYQQA